METLIDKLNDAGRRWGFAMRTQQTFKTVSHRFRVDDEDYMSFIVNKKSLLFYFRKPLRKAVSNFDRMIGKSGLKVEPKRDKYKTLIEYKFSIADDRDCNAVIQFIDANLVSPLGLKSLERPLTSRPIAASEIKSTPATDGHFADDSDIEGLLSEVVSFKRQRSRKLRDVAFGQANGICCVCERDYSKVLGGRGKRVLQVHHRDQLSARDEPSVTTVGDLAVVCANCHLLLHLDANKALSVDELRKMLRKDGYLPLA